VNSPACCLVVFWGHVLEHQLEDDVKRGAICVPDQAAMVPLLAMSMAIARSSVEPPTAWKAVVEEGMVNFIPPRLWRGRIYQKDVRGR